MKDRIMKTSNLVFTVILFLFSSLAVSFSGQQVQKVPHRFDDIAVWVKVFEDPERDKWQHPKEVVRTMNLKRDDVIADNWCY